MQDRGQEEGILSREIQRQGVVENHVMFRKLQVITSTGGAHGSHRLEAVREWDQQKST